MSRVDFPATAGASVAERAHDSPMREAVVLLIEDSPADADLVREVLCGGVAGCQLHIVTDGKRGLAFIRREGAYSDAPRVDLVLLDLHLPGLSGTEVLQAVRADPELRSTPVVVLSSSAAPDDIRRVYALQANCYVVKPPGLTQFLTTVGDVVRFWLRVAALPTSTGQGAVR